MKKHVVVIGGGIAGLFAANKFACDPNNDVTVLESQARIGGRVYTVRKPNGLQFEGGAGRIGSRASQPILWKLFDFFGLRPVPMLSTSPHVDESEIVRILERHARPDRTVREALLQAWPLEKVDAVQTTFGYDAEFDVFNSVVAKKYFNKHFRGPFYYLPEGLDVITSKLAERARAENVQIVTNQKVVRIEGDRVIVTKSDEVVRGSPRDPRTEKVFRADKVVVCLDKASLEKMEGLNLPVLQQITSVPLIRIFVQTANERAPKEKRTGPGPVRMWIPMSNGVFQVYCDSTWALRWHEAPPEVRRSWLESFLGFSDFDIIDTEFWRNGVHLWNSVPPSFESLQTTKVCFAGEVFSEGAQGWMEGAIETVRRLPFI